MTITIEAAAEQLLAGKVGIFPADTIYGLSCIPDISAINRLFDIKNRQRNQPFLMLLPRLEMLEEWVEPLNKDQKDIVKRYWPGPFTFIFKKKKTVASDITAGKSTIAIRLPNFDLLNKLFAIIKQPLLSTSLNISGQPAIHNLADVDQAIKSKIDFCYDTGKPIYGGESTLVDLTTSPFKVIRQGVKTFNE